jgi:hypothetical protein
VPQLVGPGHLEEAGPAAAIEPPAALDEPVLEHRAQHALTVHGPTELADHERRDHPVAVGLVGQRDVDDCGVCLVDRPGRPPRGRLPRLGDAAGRVASDLQHAPPPPPHSRGRPAREIGRRAVSVGSARSAVSVLRPVRFPEPPAEPDVRVAAHPALHGHAGTNPPTSLVVQKRRDLVTAVAIADDPHRPWSVERRVRAGRLPAGEVAASQRAPVRLGGACAAANRPRARRRSSRGS